MRAHFDIAKPFDPFRLAGALNAHLRPAPVAVLACEIVPGDWHARFSCTGRSYEYRIANRRARAIVSPSVFRMSQVAPSMAYPITSASAVSAENGVNQSQLPPA